MPWLIGALVSCGAATLAELQSTYGVQDAYNLAEIAAVDWYNRRPPDS